MRCRLTRCSRWVSYIEVCKKIRIKSFRVIRIVNLSIYPAHPFVSEWLALIKALIDQVL